MAPGQGVLFAKWN